LTGWQRRKARVSKKINSSPERLRLSVYRSNKHIYAQVVLDTEGSIVCSASSISKDLKSKVLKLNKTDTAKLVGEHLGKIAKEKGVEKVVFDRSGYLYHGRVKALADGLRSAGLNF
ncbi:MAG: 50S ribosomal protein L18, partial [Deltaproteobacteria bacterium]|nr:50S ribosomal protein L18 [Deltaproteobacteria bacterium]